MLLPSRLQILVGSSGPYRASERFVVSLASKFEASSDSLESGAFGVEWNALVKHLGVAEPDRASIVSLGTVVSKVPSSAFVCKIEAIVMQTKLQEYSFAKKINH